MDCLFPKKMYLCRPKVIIILIHKIYGIQFKKQKLPETVGLHSDGNPIHA